jgi:CRP-like cAMP-binding protein
LFPPYRWHFDARTLEPVRAIFFYGTRLREHCDNDPELGRALIMRMAQIMMERLQATRRQLAKVSTRALESKKSDGVSSERRLATKAHQSATH